ncbi:hypothetical protein C1645_821726 [Glomus cerebriforme]|uniref:RNase H type-1 domain-containing protein n=1 Tax=Glomus cerebriforme TaxID=658196 RepID=A0A397T1E9_9GLOM|nr:hypothetical protein C1645_821726 [Glomus cerebriforme]
MCLVALIISPINSTVTIFTDSKSSIDHFSYLQRQQLPLSPRNTFKEASNNILWNIIMDIVEFNSLKVNFVKIQAHSGIQYNETVDKLAKEFNNLNTLPLNFNIDQITTIKYVPKWNNIIIENNLRKFITSISRNRGFELFLNLFRNRKYVNDIDWIAIFFALNDEESTTETSFYASYKKSHKIKFLIEELPTIEHVKKRRPDLYDQWNCSMCKNEKETFNHIWTCDNHKDILQTLAFNYNRIYMDINNLIWKPRCDQQILNETNAGIDRKSKYKKKQNNGPSLPSTNNIILILVLILI